MPEVTSQTNIQIRFTINDPVHGDFTDALYFTPEEHAALDQAQIEKMQMERFNNWVAAITSPPVVQDTQPAQE